MKTIIPVKPAQAQTENNTLLKELHEKIEREKMENEEYYKNLIEKDPYGLPFRLYHGTDAKMLGLSSDQRAYLNSIFMGVIDALWPFFSSLKQWTWMSRIQTKVDAMPSNGTKERYERVVLDINRIHAYKTGNRYFEYGCFYLTNSLDQAKSYARLAADGGELGRLAHSIIIGAKIMGFDVIELGDVFCAQAGKVLQIADIPADPVVFEFDRLELKKLRSESGGQISNWLDKGSICFRYLGDVKLDPKDAIHI